MRNDNALAGELNVYDKSLMRGEFIGMKEHPPTPANKRLVIGGWGDLHPPLIFWIDFWIPKKWVININTADELLSARSIITGGWMQISVCTNTLHLTQSS